MIIISIKRKRNKPKIRIIKNMKITIYIVKLRYCINDTILVAPSIVDNISILSDFIFQTDLCGSSKA